MRIHVIEGKINLQNNRKGRTMMEQKECVKCGSTEFAEGRDYIKIKSSKMAISGGEKVYTFCVDCGEVDSIRIEDSILFKGK